MMKNFTVKKSMNNAFLSVILKAPRTLEIERN